MRTGDLVADEVDLAEGALAQDPNPLEVHPKQLQLIELLLLSLPGEHH